MPQVALLVAAVAVEAGIPMGVSLFATQAIGAVALSVGVGYAQQALMRSQLNGGGDQPSGSDLSQINAPEVRGSIKQDIPPHRLWLGETRGGGVVWFYEKKPPYLYLGQIHSVLPLSEVRGVFISQTALSFSSIPDNTIIAPLPSDGQPAYNNRLEVCFQLGGLSQGVNALIARDFPERGLNFKLPGIANSVWKFDYGADFDEFEALWGQVQIPDAQIVARGVPLPDPREPTHILDFDPRDMDELYAAIASWRYSNNSSLAAAFMGAMPFGLNAGAAPVYAGSRVQTLKDSADFDDERVPLKDSTETQRRYTADGIVTFDEKPLSVFESILTTNGGFASARAGELTVSSSQPLTPVATITDADILSGFRYRDNKPKRDRINTPHAQFISPENGYQDAETSWPSDADILAAQESDGEVFEQTLRLGLVSTHQRAQRVLQQFVLNNNLGKTLAAICHPRLIGVVEGDVVRVSLTTFPACNGLYSVEEWALQDDLDGVGFSLVEYDPAIPRIWNPATDEQPLVIEDDA